MHTIRLFFFNKKWRKMNRDNSTTASCVFPKQSVKVGYGTYGDLNFLWFDNNAKVVIGNYVSIGPNVMFLVGGEHNYKRITTYPFQSMIYHQKLNKPLCNNIIVEDDVWIGYNALIMPGVRIGQGSVIAARSIVTTDVPPYSIYIGTSVRKKRFSDEIIRELQSLDYSKIRHKAGDKYEEYCQIEITEDNALELIEAFKS